MSQILLTVYNMYSSILEGADVISCFASDTERVIISRLQKKKGFSLLNVSWDVTNNGELASL